MASLTIRKLDEALKRQLRLRAAHHGHSVEEEIRQILRTAAATDTPAGAARAAPGGIAEGFAAEPASRTATTSPRPDGKRALLIIGGGIAAYKSLDLIRRLKERGFAVRCILTAAAQHFVPPLSA